MEENQHLLDLWNWIKKKWLILSIILTILVVALIGNFIFQAQQKELLSQQADLYYKALIASDTGELKKITSQIKTQIIQYPKSIYTNAMVLLLAKHNYQVYKNQKDLQSMDKLLEDVDSLLSKENEQNSKQINNNKNKNATTASITKSQIQNPKLQEVLDNYDLVIRNTEDEMLKFIAHIRKIRILLDEKQIKKIDEELNSLYANSLTKEQIQLVKFLQAKLQLVKGNRSQALKDINSLKEQEALSPQFQEYLKLLANSI